jgi:hypothetical protein
MWVLWIIIFATPVDMEKAVPLVGYSSKEECLSEAKRVQNEMEAYYHVTGMFNLACFIKAKDVS